MAEGNDRSDDHPSIQSHSISDHQEFFANIYTDLKIR